MSWKASHLGTGDVLEKQKDIARTNDAKEYRKKLVAAKHVSYERRGRKASALQKTKYLQVEKTNYVIPRNKRTEDAAGEHNTPSKTQKTL